MKLRRIVSQFSADFLKGEWDESLHPRGDDGKFSDGGGSGSAKPTAAERSPNPNADANNDGVTDSSRVGVPGTSSPPPPSIPRLPNLNENERAAEARFAGRFEDDPDGLVKQYRDRLAAGNIGDAPNVYSTDDAKLLSPDYNPPGASDEGVKENRALYNAVTHQTANAIAKRAFVQHLEEHAGDSNRHILVTAGGVASGKGFALSSVGETNVISKLVTAVWDSAGEQNSTEMPWVQEQADRLGYKVTYVYVDADPHETWENPKRGVVERAAKKGRMVDAKLFAESYTIGAKNFKSFAERNKSKADFIFLENRGTPRKLAGFPGHALQVKAEQIYERATRTLKARTDLPHYVRTGGTLNERYWPD